MAFDNSSQLYGRSLLKTNLRLTGDIAQDAEIVGSILAEVMTTHEKNADEETKLFEIYLNDSNSWTKTKETRNEINNKVSIPTAWALTRTLNGYCFGEPIKYIARGKADQDGQQINKQALVERLSAMLDYANNHDATVMATLSASICGLGYKLCLPANQDEIAETGVPFVINDKFIYPQLAGIVVTNESIPKEVLGFLIGDYYDENGEKKGNQYTCWTKYAQYVFKDGEGDTPYVLTKQVIGEQEVDFVPLVSNRIPLVEIERNFLRKGDWEVAVDLLTLRHNLVSNRIDDIQQIVDYVLVLMNCKFETEEDRKTAIQDRLLELKATDPTNKPSIEILKNALDQNGIQTFEDYIDLIIQECVGVPNRQERGGGGGDTGQAVKYRNGFRDLENNAGFIIPKMDKAELKLLALCVAYCQNNSETKDVAELKPYDIRCKFMRTLNDDIVSSSQAYATYVTNGLTIEDALILSKSGTDPSEIASNARKKAEEESTQTETTTPTTPTETVETTVKTTEETA